MKVYVCFEEVDYDDHGDWELRHVFFYREDADKWVKENRYLNRKYEEMKIE